jgi:hypothetical protein
VEARWIAPLPEHLEPAPDDTPSPLLAAVGEAVEDAGRRLRWTLPAEALVRGGMLRPIIT